MHRTFGTNKKVSQIVAVGIFAMGQQMAALGEDGLQLRVPQSFSSAPAASQIDLHGDGHQIESYDEVEVIRERYPDGKVKVERQVALDANGNYVNHGPWKLYSPSEVVVAEGQYDMGKRVGNWTRWLGKNDSKVFGQRAVQPLQAAVCLAGHVRRRRRWTVNGWSSIRTIRRCCKCRSRPASAMAW